METPQVLAWSQSPANCKLWRSVLALCEQQVRWSLEDLALNCWQSLCHYSIANWFKLQTGQTMMCIINLSTYIFLATTIYNSVATMKIMAPCFAVLRRAICKEFQILWHVQDHCECLAIIGLAGVCNWWDEQRLRHSQRSIHARDGLLSNPQFAVYHDTEPQRWCGWQAGEMQKYAVHVHCFPAMNSKTKLFAWSVK